MIIKTMMVLKTTFYRAVILSLALLAGTGFAQAFTSLDDSEMSDVTGDGMSFVWTDFRMMFNPESYLEQMGSPSNNTCSGVGAVAGNYNCLRRADLRWFGTSVSAAGTATGLGVGSAFWNTSWTTDTNGYMSQCLNSGINGLGCPRGGPVKYFAAPDNPYILRVNTYDGGGSSATSIGNGVVTYQGNTAVTDWQPGNAASGSRQTVLEFLAPASETVSQYGTAQDPYRFSFWGEIESGRGAAGGGLLKSQTIIQGNAAGSAMRYYKFTQTTTSPGFNAYNTTAGCIADGDNGCKTNGTSPYQNGTLAIAYDSWLRGDFRFSVAQDSNGKTSDAIGVPVDFHPKEGMYFRNAEVHVPLGQLFYQALTINMPRNAATNAPIKDGNFTLEVPILPNQVAVYTRFYSIKGHTGAAAPNSWDDGYATARAAYLYGLPVRGGTTPSYMPAITGATIAGYSAPDANYQKTHGFVYWGDWSPCGGVGCSVPVVTNNSVNLNYAKDGVGRNAWNSSGDGVFFIGATSFDAYAYSPLNVDTATGAKTYTAITYYKGSTNQTLSAINAAQGNFRTNPVYNPTNDDYTNSKPAATNVVTAFTACTPSNAADFTTCGNGGAYPAAPSGYNTTLKSKVPVERFWSQSGSNPGTAASRPYIVVPAGEAVNLGDARIEGLQINLFRFSSYGALN